MITHYFFGFIIFGAVGWLMEIIWTGVGSLLCGNFKLTATTSLWMFFIYGLAVFLEPLSSIMANYPIYIRGGVYAFCIIMTEFITGSLLKSFGFCPWDYSFSRFNINGVIRLDFIPVWFIAGLIFEMIISSSMI